MDDPSVAEVAPVVRGEAAAMAGERLEAELCLLAAHDASLMYRRLVMLAEFDRRELAGSWGMVSTAAWLAWRTSLDPRTAREQVRVARALSGLAATAEAMARGELTYSKVRALTRFVTPAVEAQILELAMHATAAQLEVVARWMAREAKLNDPAARRSVEPVVRTWFDDDGTGVLQARLAPEDLALVLRALDAIVESMRDGEEQPPAAGGEVAGSGSAEPPAGEEQDGAAVGGAVVDGSVVDGSVVDGSVVADEGPWAIDDEDEGYVPGPAEPVLIDGWFVYPDDDDDEEEAAADGGWVVDHGGGGADWVGAGSGVGGSAEPLAQGGRPAVGVVDIGKRRAEALPLLAASVLGGGGGSGLGFGGDRYLINVFADVSVLEGASEANGQLNLLDDGSVVSSAVVQRLACSEPLALIVNDKDANPLYQGRKTRLANTRQRRAAMARSGGMCAFPACTRRVWVQIHHCDPWGRGGASDIDQLAPLCWYHHHCVHEGGFRVEPAPGGFAFFTPDGRRIEEAPSITGGLTLAEIREHLARPVRPKPLASAPWAGSGERMDLDMTLSAVFSVMTRADHPQRQQPPGPSGSTATAA